MYRSRGRGRAPPGRAPTYGTGPPPYGNPEPRPPYNPPTYDNYNPPPPGYGDARPPPYEEPRDYREGSNYGYNPPPSSRGPPPPRSRGPPPRAPPPADHYRSYESEPYSSSRRAPEPRSRDYPKPSYDRDRKRPRAPVESAHRINPPPRKRRDTRPPPKRVIPAKRATTKRPVKPKTAKSKPKPKVKKTPPKPKRVTHDMKLRSVIFASGTPGKDEHHDFLVSRYHNHPTIGCIPRVKIADKEFHFVLEVSEHEKDRRRKYSRNSNRGLCRWKISKSDVVFVRSFEGDSKTDPGPEPDFSTMQTTIIEGTKEVPINIDDSDDVQENAQEEKTEAQDGGTETIDVTVAPPEADKLVDEDAMEDITPEALDPASLENEDVATLQNHCKERDLHSEGDKDELIQRLTTFLEEKQQPKEPEGDSNMFDGGNDDEEDIIVEENPPADAEKAEPTDVPAEPMDVAAEAADEPAEKDSKLALFEVDSVPEKFKELATLINQVQEHESGYWFVPDLTLVENWNGVEDDLKSYLSKISDPMSFSVLREQIDSFETEEQIVEKVHLIFDNALAFNGAESDWHNHASTLKSRFDSLYGDLTIERELISTDDEGKLKFEGIPESILRKIVEAADLKHEGADKDGLVKLAKEAADKVDDVKTIIVNAHRALMEAKQQEAEEKLVESKYNALYVVVGLNHELRQVHLDRDIISSTHAKRARFLVLEFRKDITSKMNNIRKRWQDFFQGPAKGIEKSDMYSEENEAATFEALVSKVIGKSNEHYKKDKKLATVEELVINNKSLKATKQALETKLIQKSEENDCLKRLLEDIYRQSDWKRSLPRLIKKRADKAKASASARKASAQKEKAKPATPEAAEKK